MLPRLIRGAVSWRSLLLLAGLAAVLQLASFVLSWHVWEFEQQLNTGDASADTVDEQLMVSKGQYQQPLADRPMPIHANNIKQPTWAKRSRKSAQTDLYSSLLHRLSRQSAVDSSGLYRLAEDFFTPTPPTAAAGVALVTQCSPRHLHRLGPLLRRWQGPVSVAVLAVTVGEVQWLVEAVLQLRRCNGAVLRRVTVSVVTPVTLSSGNYSNTSLLRLSNQEHPHKPIGRQLKAALANEERRAQHRKKLRRKRLVTEQSTPDDDGDNNNDNNNNKSLQLEDYLRYSRRKKLSISTKSFIKHLAALNEINTNKVYGDHSPVIGPCEVIPAAPTPLGITANYELAGVEYPTNLLRNVALRAAHARYALVLDVDMIPSSGLYRQLTELYNGGSLSTYDSTLSVAPGELVAFVLPAYEVLEGVAMPSTKLQLLALVAQGKAEPFYSRLCEKCQAPTNYTVWERLPPGAAGVAYEVVWRDPWEPFYVAAVATLPPYDPGFRQYGFNRISQVCELHVAGFRFLVLSEAFVLHRGYKRPGRLHSTKDTEQRDNRLRFRRFKQQLKLKYPNSKRRCY